MRRRWTLIDHDRCTSNIHESENSISFHPSTWPRKGLSFLSRRCTKEPFEGSVSLSLSLSLSLFLSRSSRSNARASTMIASLWPVHFMHLVQQRRSSLSISSVAVYCYSTLSGNARVLFIGRVSGVSKRIEIIVYPLLFSFLISRFYTSQSRITRRGIKYLKLWQLSFVLSLFFLFFSFEKFCLTFRLLAFERVI